jgi:hypothetical protein
MGRPALTSRNRSSGNTAWGTQPIGDRYIDSQGNVRVRTVRIGPEPTTIQPVAVPIARAVIRQTAASVLPNGVPFQLSVNLNLAPVEIQHQQLGAVYEEIARPGRQSLMVWSKPQLEQVSFEAVIVADTEPGINDCEEKLLFLKVMAQLPTNIVFAYGNVSSNKVWRMTDFSYSSVMRHRDTDRIVRASAQITLTEQVPAGAIVPGFQVIKDTDRPAARSGPSSNTPNTVIVDGCGGSAAEQSVCQQENYI